MLKLYIQMQVILLGLEDRLERRADERGSVTIEHVGWAVAVIAIVGIVVAAIKTYVTSESGKIK